MHIIGLTGGIGSGKSTVADLFQTLGVPLVDTDQIAHQISQPGQAGALAVGELFGDGFLTPAGAIDRPKLRTKVFGQAAALKQLEAALHPLIQQEAMRQLAALPQDQPYCLLAVPLLLETGSYRHVIDRTLVVDCPEDVQISRVMRRSQLSEAEIRAIMAKQVTREQRLSQADDIVLNAGDLPQLTDTVKELHRKYLQAYE
ncbi:dephospho-CoA kinase [Chitinimonas arctica]|uniref:Dephospho-CoA kinase n=1 Tax=Chitinimonas arctica TaxID=2594795 RepID=A0A516SDW7_9NEIS|nr:dephospho-CoA kinase [Chitinimonas arctica]QDQ26352.1 dephospho-CoA kinase [Chitinimonas arctica]